MQQKITIDNQYDPFLANFLSKLINNYSHFLHNINY